MRLWGGLVPGHVVRVLVGRVPDPVTDAMGERVGEPVIGERGPGDRVDRGARGPDGGGLHGEFLHGDIGEIQVGKLRRQRPDVAGMDTGAVGQTRHFDAAAGGQVGNQAGVPYISLER